MKRPLSLFRGRFFATSGWSAFAVGVSAVTGVTTARALGPDSRGTLALVLSIAGLCVLLSAFGTNVAVRRHLPRRSGVNMQGYKRVSFMLLVPLVTVLVGVMFTAAAWIDPRFGNWKVGLAFAAYGVCYYLSNQALDLLNALGMVTQSARTNALGSLVCLCLVVASAIAGLGLVTIVLCYALSTVFQFILAVTSVVRRGLRDVSPARGMLVLVKDGGRLLGLNLGQSLTYRADTVILGALASQNQVGMYAVATTPAAILRIPANALGQVAFHQAATGDAGLRTTLKRIGFLLAAMVPIVVAGWLSANWLFLLVFGADYENAVQPFRILLLAEFALIPFLVLGRTIAGQGGTWGASLCGMIGVAVLIVGALILIPGQGATGAAWASVLAYGAMSATSLLVAIRSNARPKSGSQKATLSA